MSSYASLPSFESARAEEGEPTPPFVAPASAPLVATTDKPADAVRDEAPEFDDKHFVRIPTREVSIHVFDEHDHAPIVDAVFKLDKHELAGLPPFGEARSDRDGMASFTIPTDRAIHVTAEAKGFTPAVELVPDEPLGTREQPLAIALPRAASIHGRVFGPDGAPRRGDRVGLQSSEVGIDYVRTRMIRSHRSVDPKSDPATNEFLFEDVPAEVEVRLTIEDGDDLERVDTMPFFLEPGERREVEWHVGNRSSVAGRVVDDAGEPVAGARVRVMQEGFESGPLSQQPATDANGEFEFVELDAGRCFFDVHVDDARHAHGSFACKLAPGEQRRGVVVVLKRAAPLVVRARVPDGGDAPIVGARVMSSVDRLGIGSDVQREPDGSLKFAAAPLGDVDVTAEVRRGDFHALGLVRFHHDGTHECVVDCAAVASIEGTVELGPGKPADSGARFCLIHRDVAVDDALFRSSFDTQSAVFQHADVAPGEYDLVATSKDGWVGALSSLSIGAGERREGLVVRVEPSVTLRLTAPPLDERVGGSLPEYRRLVVRVRRAGACVATASVLPESHSELPVPPGKLTVEIWSGGDLLASRDFEAHFGEISRVRF